MDSIDFDGLNFSQSISNDVKRSPSISNETMELLKATLIVTVLAYIVATILYVNPLAAGLYKKSAKTGILKTWKKQKHVMGLHFLFMLIQVLFYSWIFSLITIHTATTWVCAGLYFGIFIFLIRILPRFMDMFVMVNYPVKLLVLELFNGLIISMVAAMGISYLLY